jgi:hypothetical protein
MQTLDPVSFSAGLALQASHRGATQLRQEVKIPVTRESDGVAAATGNRVIAVPSPALRDSDGIIKATRDKGPHEPTVGAEALEPSETQRDPIGKPLASAINSHGLRASPTTGSRPGPPPRDGHDPSKHLLGLEGLIASARRVTLGDDPQLGLRPLQCDQSVTDQPSPEVKHNQISDPKLRRADGLHGHAISLPQGRVHAPPGHAEAEGAVAEEEVTDLHEIRQVEAISSDPCRHPFPLAGTPQSPVGST